MEIAKAVSTLGTRAVVELVGGNRPEFQPRDETVIDETWFSLLFKESLPESHPDWQVKDRQSYRLVAREFCGAEFTKADEFRRFFDLLVIVPSQPQPRIGIVEYKIVDESRPWDRRGNSMITDYEKIQRFQKLIREKGSAATVEGCIGALVCDLSDGTTAEDTIRHIQGRFPAVAIEPGTRTCAKGGGWGWRFICGKMPALL